MGKSLYSSTQQFQHSHGKGNGRPGHASTPAAGAGSGFRGYLAVIFIHISACRGKNKRFLSNQQAFNAKKEGTSLQSLAAAPTARAALALLGQQAWEGHVPSRGAVLRDARVSILLGLPRSPPRAERPWAGLGQRGTPQGTRGGSGEGDRLCAPRSKGRGGFVPHSVTDF